MRDSGSCVSGNYSDKNNVAVIEDKGIKLAKTSDFFSHGDSRHYWYD